MSATTLPFPGLKKVTVPPPTGWSLRVTLPVRVPVPPPQPASASITTSEPSRQAHCRGWFGRMAVSFGSLQPEARARGLCEGVPSLALRACHRLQPEARARGLREGVPSLALRACHRLQPEARARGLREGVPSLALRACHQS